MPLTEAQKASQKKYYENMSPEDKRARLDKRNAAARIRRKKQKESETLKERLERLDKINAYNKKRRDAETPEERKTRLEKAKERTRKYRANETPERRKTRLAKAALYIERNYVTTDFYNKYAAVKDELLKTVNQTTEA